MSTAKRHGSWQTIMPCQCAGEACVQAFLRGFRQAALLAPQIAMSLTVQNVQVQQLHLPCSQQYGTASVYKLWCAASHSDHLCTYDACPSAAQIKSSHFVAAMPLHDGNGHCIVVPVQNQSVKFQAHAVVTDAQPFHDAPLTRCRLRRGTRHNGVRWMFIDPETSMHVGTMGHVSSHSLHAYT